MIGHAAGFFSRTHDDARRTPAPPVFSGGRAQRGGSASSPGGVLFYGGMAVTPVRLSSFVSPGEAAACAAAIPAGAYQVRTLMMLTV
jgi:hypothetical protein